MILGQKTLHRTATMARFRTTDVNAAAFAAMRRLLDRDIAFLWLHGPRKTGKGYALSALHRAFAAALPNPINRHVYLDGAHLRFVFAGLAREAPLAPDGLVRGLALVPSLLIDDVEGFLGHPDRQALLADVIARRSTWGRPTALASRHHPLTLDLQGSLVSLSMERTFALGTLPITARRAVVQHEAGRHAARIPQGVVSFLARNGGTTEDQLRRTTRRVLLSLRVAELPVTLPRAQQLVR